MSRWVQSYMYKGVGHVQAPLWLSTCHCSFCFLRYQNCSRPSFLPSFVLLFDLQEFSLEGLLALTKENKKDTVRHIYGDIIFRPLFTYWHTKRFMPRSQYRPFQHRIKEPYWEFCQLCREIPRLVFFFHLSFGQDTHCWAPPMVVLGTKWRQIASPGVHWFMLILVTGIYVRFPNHGVADPWHFGTIRMRIRGSIPLTNRSG